MISLCYTIDLVLHVNGVKCRKYSCNQMCGVVHLNFLREKFAFWTEKDCSVYTLLIL